MKGQSEKREKRKYKNKWDKTRWKLQLRKDNYVGLVLYIVQCVEDGTKRHCCEFVMTRKIHQVDHTLHGGKWSGEVLN